MNIAADPACEIGHAVAEKIEPLVAERGWGTWLEHGGKDFFPGIVTAAKLRKFLQVQRAVTVHAVGAVIVQAEVIVDP